MIADDIRAIQYGTACSLWIDLPTDDPQPRPGDIVVKISNKSAYIVVSARIVNRRKPRQIARYVLQCTHALMADATFAKQDPDWLLRNRVIVVPAH